MSTLTAASPALASVLVIGPEAVAQALQPSCGRAQPIVRTDDVLAGLERLAVGGVRTVFAWMASLPARTPAALAAMRELLGPDARIYLIARPDEEPAARLLAAGDADDYLIWPLQNNEVARVLGVRPAAAAQDKPLHARRRCRHRPPRRGPRRRRVRPVRLPRSRRRRHRRPVARPRLHDRTARDDERLRRGDRRAGPCRRHGPRPGAQGSPRGRPATKRRLRAPPMPAICRPMR